MEEAEAAKPGRLSDIELDCVKTSRRICFEVSVISYPEYFTPRYMRESTALFCRFTLS